MAPYWGQNRTLGPFRHPNGLFWPHFKGPFLSCVIQKGSFVVYKAKFAFFLKRDRFSPGKGQNEPVGPFRPQLGPYQPHLGPYRHRIEPFGFILKCRFRHEQLY